LLAVARVPVAGAMTPVSRIDPKRTFVVLLRQRAILQGLTVCSIRDLVFLKPSIIPRTFVWQR